MGQKLFDKIGYVDDDISTEDIGDIKTDKIIAILDPLVEQIRKDSVMRITNSDILTIDTYSKHLNELSKHILNAHNIELTFATSNTTNVKVNQDDIKTLTFTLLSDVKKGQNKQNIDTADMLTKLDRIIPNVKSNKLSHKVSAVISVDFIKVIAKDNKDTRYVAELISGVVVDIINTNYGSKDMVKKTIKVVADITSGSSLSQACNKHYNTNLDNADSSYKNMVKLINSLHNNYIDRNVDKGDRLSILVRIQYLLLLIFIVIVILVALNNPALLLSSIALISYSILLYVYKLAYTILTGDKNPLNENINKLLNNDDRYVTKADKLFTKSIIDMFSIDAIIPIKLRAVLSKQSEDTAIDKIANIMEDGK